MQVQSSTFITSSANCQLNNVKAYFMMNSSKLLLSVELLVVSGMLSDLYILA